MRRAHTSNNPLQLTENIRRVATNTDLMTAFSANVQERYEAYIECLMRLHEQQPARGFAVSAFETSELGRGRALSEMLALQPISSLASIPF